MRLRSLVAPFAALALACPAGANTVRLAYTYDTQGFFDPAVNRTPSRRAWRSGSR